jgi:hypothetical protein
MLEYFDKERMRADLANELRIATGIASAEVSPRE